MDDAQLTLGKGESIKVYAYQNSAKGNLSIAAFVYLDEKGVLSISADIGDGGRDDFVVEIDKGVIVTKKFLDEPT